MLSVERLKVFAAVVEEGTFTAAAARLNATQSGVSQQVAKLEQSLGTKLIERFVAAHFEGNAKIDYRPEGVHYQIISNAANLSI